MSPLAYLGCCLLVSLAAFLIDWADDMRMRSRLRRLAGQNGLHFFPGDRFKFACDVAERFPVIGVADPEVNHLIHGRRDDHYFYVFRFDYTVGVTGRKQRRRAIVAFSEPVRRQARRGIELRLAQPVGPVDAQYQAMIRQLTA